MKHLFPGESESQLYAHIERLRLAELERERVERMDRAREARILRDYHLWMMGRECVSGCAQVALMLECGPFPMSLDACIDHDKPQPAQPPWSGVKWI